MLMKNPKNIPLLKRSDLLLIAFVLLAAAVIFFMGEASAQGTTAVVTLDGERVTEIKLEAAENESFSVGNVVIEISDGSVRVADSDCPDKTCVKTGKLSECGDVSVCIPNRVAVEIIGEADDGVDIIGY